MSYIGEPFNEAYYAGNNPLGYTDITQEGEFHRTWADDIEEQTGLVSGKRVLEIGCAFGYLTDELALRGADVTGIDISAYAIAQAQTLFPARDFVNVDILDVTYSNNTFDLIVAMRVFECFPSQPALRGAWLKLFKLCKPSGAIYVTAYEQHTTYYTLSVSQWETLLVAFPGGWQATVTRVGDQPLSAAIRIVVS